MSSHSINSENENQNDSSLLRQNFEDDEDVNIPGICTRQGKGSEDGSEQHHPTEDLFINSPFRDLQDEATDALEKEESLITQFENHRELFEEIERLDYIYDDLKRQENEYKNKLTFPEKNLSIDYNKEDIDEEFKKFKNHIQTVKQK